MSGEFFSHFRKINSSSVDDQRDLEICSTPCQCSSCILLAHPRGHMSKDPDMPGCKHASTLSLPEGTLWPQKSVGMHLRQAGNSEVPTTNQRGQGISGSIPLVGWF